MFKNIVIATLLGTTAIEGIIILRQRNEYRSLFAHNGALLRRYIDLSAEYVRVKEDDLKTTKALRYILDRCREEEIDLNDFDFIVLDTLINQ